jgi:DNA (cytosine-5)-methyltransferase 1
MGVLYRKLWMKIAEKEMKRTDLKDVVGISSNTLAKLGKNEYISLEILERIARYMQCDIGDIVEINSDDSLEKR